MHPVEPGPIAIRKVESFCEMDACIALQRAVWNFPDLELVPRRILVVSSMVGGQIFGAWDGNTLAGFAYAVVGIRNGRTYLHSHMLAVLPEYRNHGLGVRLKLAQREDAISRGIELMEWTFDPAQEKNAYLNIEKLGAIIRRYTPDFYGSSATPVDSGLPTDRMHAEWWLRSRRVENLLNGGKLPEYEIQETIPVTYTPAAADATLLASPAPLESRLHLRKKLQQAFARGLAVLRFTPGGEARYLLGNVPASDGIGC